jgi:hypothetical protein
MDAGAHREAESLGFPVEVASAHPPALVLAYLCS